MQEAPEAVEVGMERGGGAATVSVRFALEVMEDVYEKDSFQAQISAFFAGFDGNVAENDRNACNFESDLITYGRKETCGYYQGVYVGNPGSQEKTKLYQDKDI
jgi:hypothetical protein